MPSRFEPIALAVLIAITVIACVAIAYQIGDHDERHYAGEPRTRYELAEKPVAPRLNRRPPPDRSICRESETEKEYELCQAWRSAEGAKDSALAAWLQIALSIGALIGLYYTVRYTRQAALAASQAARESARAVEVQIRIEAPLLVVEKSETRITSLTGEFGGSVGPQGVVVSTPDQIRLFLRNAGKGSAILVEWTAECETLGDLPAEPVYGRIIALRGRLLARDEGEEFPVIVEKSLADAIGVFATTYLWGYFRYEDALGIVRTTGFGYVGHPFGVTPTAYAGILWARAGGKAYNYDREEK